MKIRPGIVNKATWTILFFSVLLSAFIIPDGNVNAQNKSAIITALSTDKTGYAAGEQVTITLAARNTGENNLQLLCSIIIINPSGNQKYSYSHQYTLAAGTSGVYQVYWTIPGNSPAGNYQVQSTISDAKDGSFFSSRTTSFIHQAASHLLRSASLLALAVDKQSLMPGETVTFSVSMQNTGETDVNIIVSVEVINPSGIQVYNGARETNLDRGSTDIKAFVLPIPDTADIGTYQAQATIADRSDGKLYGSRSATLYVQTSIPAGNNIATNDTSDTGLQQPVLAFSEWVPYLIAGLLISLAAIVVFIMIKNRPRKKTAHFSPDTGENKGDQEKTGLP